MKIVRENGMGRAGRGLESAIFRLVSLISLLLFHSNSRISSQPLAIMTAAERDPAQQPANDAVKPTASREEDVGLIFVREYYTFLNKKPHRLHAFYGKNSSFVRGSEGEVTETYVGQKKIEELNFQDCKVLVTQVDSLVSENNGLLIQVLGEMCNRDGPSQKFAQTFFLATQPNGYFVLTDIFRFLKDEVDIDYYACEDEDKVQPVTEPAVEKTTGTPNQTMPVTTAAPTESPSTDVTPANVESSVPASLKHTTVESVSQPAPPRPAESKSAEPRKGSKDEDKKRKGPAVQDKKEGSDAAVLKGARSEKKSEETQRKNRKNEKRSEKKGDKQGDKAAEKSVEKQDEKQEEESSQPPAPKTWANLAANDSSKWGTQATETKAQAVPVPAANSESPTTVTTPSPTTQTSPKSNEQKQGYPKHEGYRHHDKDFRKEDVTDIFVKNVTSTITEEELQQAFSQFGSVKSLNIIQAKNCAFLDFTTPEARQKAIAQHRVTVGEATVLAEERRSRGYSHSRQQQNGTPFERRFPPNRRGGGPRGLNNRPRHANHSQGTSPQK
ncbi:uncharacterized protein BYT42DRAFT_100147 [Radiomyces spectabilis]|uniref:uncharacterized protein n=1 Tax=Radiomyces spectabilis TaxID=64574 RepID=UPI00222108CB|nr:uncharacterized protein BYT42DRAFT_100147 [Radiomyces spectabilis]KAI8370718.1 hypothetical protein BYT42DRAFT_100147 [Radiomyces spectabilis]